MKVLFLLAILTLSAAACSTSSEAEPSIRPLGDPEVTTSTTAAPTTTAPTTTTTEPDPWARPANPDAAYFERVLNELEEINTAVFRRVRDKGAVTPDIEAVLRATKTDVNLEYELAVANAFAEEFPDDLTLSRAPSLSDVRVIEVSDDCALLEVTISFEGVHSYERASGRFFNVLLTTDASEINPTGWMSEQRWTTENAPDLSCDR